MLTPASHWYSLGTTHMIRCLVRKLWVLDRINWSCYRPFSEASLLKCLTCRSITRKTEAALKKGSLWSVRVLWSGRPEWPRRRYVGLFWHKRLSRILEIAVLGPSGLLPNRGHVSLVDMCIVNVLKDRLNGQLVMVIHFILEQIQVGLA